ncbi:MAG: molybdenum cofactor biosynthesis protein MoaB [Deltaproteobacteria bacterium]|nr:molybdenum cofactor biosynthesis protein MoaB [Deltaproteobacteria bacterium]
MSTSTDMHRKEAPKTVSIAIITVSTSRDLRRDKSGEWISSAATLRGHTVLTREVVPDNRQRIQDAIHAVATKDKPQLLIVTGGTGIGSTDVTIEAIRPLFSKELTAFSCLFAQLSYHEIGSAALLSRATAGLIESTVTFCLPGSLHACKLALETLIFPEIGHLARHAGR